ncbi:MIZ/SP-RING zinc finger, partial [Aphelenchoides avenae]
AAGRELKAQQVYEKYDEIRRSSRRIPRQQALKLVDKYYSQDEVQVESAKKLKLVCPLSKRRIVDACRGEHCVHLECFDLRSYLQYHTQLTYWKCPLGCGENVPLESLRIDEYVMSVLRGVPEACLEVEILADSSFKAVIANDPTDLVEVTDESQSELQEPTTVKEEPPDVVECKDIAIEDS